MDRWARTLVASLLSVGIEFDLIAKYVDDVNTVLPTIACGLRWTRTWDMTWTAQAWAKDKEPGAMTPHQRTMHRILE